MANSVLLLQCTRRCISFLCIAFLFSITTISAQPQQFRFDRITVADGLSDNVVNCIVQDRYGFIWIGTNDGLNRYDGKSFKLYRNKGTDRSSLVSSRVRDLTEDKNGDLWIIAGGLHRYDRERDNFIRYPADSLGKNGPHTSPFIFEYDSSDNVLWLGTQSGLVKFDLENKIFTSVDVGDNIFAPQFLTLDKQGNVWLGGYLTRKAIRVDKTTLKYNVFSQPVIIPSNHLYFAPTKGLPSFQMNSLFIDNNDTTWILFSQGVWRYDWRSNRSEFLFDTSYTFYAQDMKQDQLGRTWVATYNKGILLADWNERKFTTFRYNSSDPTSPGSSMIHTIYVDRIGNVWFGTSKGITLLSRWKKPFSLFTHNTENQNSLMEGEVTAIAEDGDGTLWIAVTGKGVSRLLPKASEFKHYTGAEKIFNHWIRSLFIDKFGRLQVGSSAPSIYDSKKDRFLENDWFPSVPDQKLIRHFSYPPNTYLKEDNGNQWYCFFNGIVRIGNDGKVKKWSIADSSTGLRTVNTGKIYKDKSGTLWVASPSLHRYDPLHERFVEVKGLYLLNVHRTVRTMLEDASGNFWVGMDIGVGLYDRKGDSLKILFNRQNGLGGRNVYGMLEDDHNNLWVSIDAGLAKVNTKTLSIHTFGIDDGIPPFTNAPEHSWGNNSHIKLQDKRMVFGRGSNGFIIFHPDSIKDNPNIPPVYITGFSVANNPVPIKQDSILTKNIILADTIRLRYDQNDFSFEFAALDYTAPHNNQYKYRLEGLEEKWIESGNRNVAYYTNIDPGEYRFHVLGSNNDGLWNEQGASVLVIISPPWWKTNWAYASYLFLFVSLLYTARRYELNRQQLKHRAEVEHIETEQLKEVDKIKTRFFANISHEFRTPLTLIEGPLKQLQTGEHKGSTSELYGMMLRNTRRLRHLVNQLLDLARFESKEMKLQIRQGDIASHIKSIAASFESAAIRKGITFSVTTEPEFINAWYDSDALEKILNNLLSNAFKFTPEGGSVTIACHSERSEESNSRYKDSSVVPIPSGLPQNDKRSNVVAITVTDTGIGIPSDQREKVFDRFYQVDNSHTREYEGTGIGLSLVKELVELHKGAIIVQSEPQKGTTFTVQLPIDRESYSETDIINDTSDTKHRDDIVVSEESYSSVPEPESSGGLPSLLIIEDNADMRRYIRSHIEEQFSITEAVNGEDGVERAIETIPDLIISDVMMPKMDGFEVCKRLKSDLRTSHIPIILLTAKAGQEHKIEGLETGADEYLVKPFDAKELLVRLNNLQEQRKRLREHIQRELTSFPKTITTQPANDKFLQKIFAIIEQNFGDAEFDIQSFAEESAMSRMQLHRKIKSLTGYSPGELLRNFRLQRASEMLKQRTGNVSEIAYEVGYNNLSHFAAQFHEKYGVNPSEY